MNEIKREQQRRELESRDEVRKVLALIYFEWGKVITEELVSYWLEQFRAHRITKTMAREIAAKLTAEKTFGEPKFQDFYQMALRLYGERPQPYFDPRSSPQAMAAYEALPLRLPGDSKGKQLALSGSEKRVLKLIQ